VKMSEGPATGVLGGTFDPVHLGHLVVAERVRAEFSLHRTIMLLAAQPPHKDHAGLSTAADRLAMLKLALIDHPALEIGTYELERDEVCYTINTLRALRDGDPECRPVFIMGMDSLLELPTWRDYLELIAEFDLIVVDRPGESLGAIRQELDPAIVPRIVPHTPGSSTPGAGGRIYHFPFEPIPISSSAIRELTARGGDLHGLVTPAVAKYIQVNSLYRQEENH